MNAAGCIHTPVWQAKPYSTKGRDPNWREEEEEEEEEAEATKVYAAGLLL